MLVESLDKRASRFAAALAPHDEGAWDMADEMRENFDRDLVSVPERESESSRILRELGVRHGG